MVFVKALFVEFFVIIRTTRGLELFAEKTAYYIFVCICLVLYGLNIVRSCNAKAFDNSIAIKRYSTLPNICSSAPAKQPSVSVIRFTPWDIWLSASETIYFGNKKSSVSPNMTDYKMKIPRACKAESNLFNKNGLDILTL